MFTGEAQNKFLGIRKSNTLKWKVLFAPAPLHFKGKFRHVYETETRVGMSQRDIFVDQISSGGERSPCCRVYVSYVKQLFLAFLLVTLLFS